MRPIYLDAHGTPSAKEIAYHKQSGLLTHVAVPIEWESVKWMEIMIGQHRADWYPLQVVPRFAISPVDPAQSMWSRIKAVGEAHQRDVLACMRKVGGSFILPIGHLGGTCCAASKAGAAACLKDGWKAEAWEDWCADAMNACDIFPEAIVQVVPLMLRGVPLSQNLVSSATHWGGTGRGLSWRGLSADSPEFPPEALSLMDAARKAKAPCVMGDDWPLVGYKGRDVRYFTRVLDQIRTGGPKAAVVVHRGVSLMCCPSHKTFDPKVASALRAFKDGK